MGRAIMRKNKDCKWNNVHGIELKLKRNIKLSILSIVSRR